ncbi:MAG: helix-turn-helix domain-containing protein [Thermomicrobia bacterium]|nr:helix-turn-helix domain-containing protein [Thermomicrobia bacterium]
MSIEMQQEFIRTAERRWMEQKAALEAAYEQQRQNAALDPLMSVKEAAAYRGVQPAAIYDAIHRGTLDNIPLHPPEMHPARRAYRIRKSALDAFKAGLPKHPLKVDFREIAQRERANGFLTVDDVAKLLNVSRVRVNAICQRKNNPLHRQQIDGVWFIKRADAYALRDERALKGLQNL